MDNTPAFKNGTYACKPVGTVSIQDTQNAIKLIKDTFQTRLSSALNLTRVSAPLFVTDSSGLNDDLANNERAVKFDLKSGETCAVVQSLAKWKRMALARYKFTKGTGLYTDMNAIRRDEVISPLHSYYVDQWDWELIIDENERTMSKLKEVVRKIYAAIRETEKEVNSRYNFSNKLPEHIFFISSQDLEDQYPTLTVKEREDEITKQHLAVFITGIGQNLRSGKPHDLRAPDYDDWELNGDILVYSDVINCAVELSSMGIRVTKTSLLSQLEQSGNLHRLSKDFHTSLMQDKLPFTIGGGIGQSRLCLFFLEKRHIGEVQVSVWPKMQREELLKENIFLL
ncbi:aspartate--ammonia ligase [Paragonimus westermani]|uniref:Aspartate--ammonia ligase n=1 Tax=Paragonimus westermani TaxID=34504 RepID=A0A5J4NUN5_9TREM|nr:aspartate--ammonia ligase [Paragonimus westermani]